MSQYIDKSALVAEIKRRQELASNPILLDNDLMIGERNAYFFLLSFINTLEVKEVDDEPECKIFPRPIECYSNCKECLWLATNNKAQKGEKL